MREGLNHQIPLIAQMAGAGEIKVETLEQSGRWFRKNFPLTPPTSVVALDDWKNQGHRTVWYDSRFYRLNMLWSKDSFFVRDIHCFDENIVSPTHDTPLKEASLTYETLPIVDWAFWSDSGRKQAGMFPVLVAADGAMSPMQPEGSPLVKELNPTDLSIVQPLKGGGTFSIVCTEKAVVFSGVTDDGKPLGWACKIVGGDQLKALVKSVNAASVVCNHSGVEYQLQLGSAAGSCRQLQDGSIQLLPNHAGKLVLKFDAMGISTVSSNQTSALSQK